MPASFIEPGAPSENAARLLERVRELESRLAESEETLAALRNGEVDAIVASGAGGDRIYTLKGADEAYRQIVEEMAEGALTLTPAGLILFSNEPFARLAGIPLERVIGAQLQDFIAAEDAGVLPLFHAHASGGGKAEVRLRVPGAAPVPVYISWKPVRHDGLECICVIVTDLSEQKRNREIDSAEKLARSILEQAAEAMLVVDPAGKIVRASRAADRLAAVPVLMRRFDEVFSVRGGADAIAYTFREILATVRLGAAIEGMETTAVMPDGRALQLLLSAAPLAGTAGELLGCIVSLIDITARKQTEQALRASNEALSRSNDDLKRFAFVASHDLQEPLRMITTYAQLMVKEYGGRGESNAEMYVGNIVDGTRRMRELIADLLTYTELRGETEQPPETVDLNGIIETVKLNLQASIDETQAAVVADPLPAIRGHAAHFVALFQNLVGNAIKYRGEEPPRVHIFAEESGNDVRFSVRDNGIGINPDYYETIFVAFKRLHGRAIPGTGIGLAICQRVVERYGGRIWVESEAGHGATFRFTLPRKTC